MPKTDVPQTSAALFRAMRELLPMPAIRWTVRRDALDRYLEGWAEANVKKIVAATADGYRFDDPLVGTILPAIPGALL